MTVTQRSRGRPTVYDEQTASDILARLAEGESLRSICRSDEMPAESTVRLWALDDREGFAARYTRARELQAERWAEEVLDISDNGKAGDMVQMMQLRLRVDARKWLLSKLLPKKYGESATLKHTGPDGGAVEVSVTRRIVDNADTDTA